MSNAPDQRPASPKISADTKAMVPVGVLVGALLVFCIWIHGRTAAVEISIARIEAKVDIVLMRTGVTLNAMNDEINRVAGVPAPTSHNP